MAQVSVIPPKIYKITKISYHNCVYISGAPELTVLTLFDTPVSLTKHYRHHAVNTIWSLKVR